MLAWAGAGPAITLLAPQSRRANPFLAGTDAGISLWFANVVRAPAFLAFIVVVVLGFALLAVIASVFCRAAIIGLARDAELLGQTTVSDGFRNGWRNVLPLVAIYVLIYVGFALVSALALAGVLSPLLLGYTGNRILSAVGIILAVLLGIVAIILWIAGVIVLAMVEPLIVRSRVLRRLGVFGSIVEGFRLLRRKTGQVALIWLLIYGLSYFGMLMVFTVAAFLGAVVLISALAAFQASQTAGIIVGAILAVPALVALLLALALVQVYVETMWTLAFLRITSAEEGQVG